MHFAYALIAISTLIMVIVLHELGHFTAAKLCHIPVKVFSIGFGKRLFGFKMGETDFRFSLIPLGGYVTVEGEAESGGGDVLKNAHVFKRLCYFAGGVVFNLLTALFVISTAQFMVRSPNMGTVLNVLAANCPLHEGDVLLEVNGVAVTESMAVPISTVVDRVVGNAVPVKVKHTDGRIETVVAPLTTNGTEKRMGIMLAKGREGKSTLRVLADSVSAGLVATQNAIKLQFVAIWDLLTGQSKAKVMGPIGVGVTTYKLLVKSGNWLMFFGITSQISIGLAIMNLLLIPGLDGWFCVLALIEMVRRKPLSEKFASRSLHYGYMVLISMFVLVIGMDVVRTFMQIIGKG